MHTHKRLFILVVFQLIIFMFLTSCSAQKNEKIKYPIEELRAFFERDTLITDGGYAYAPNNTGVVFDDACRLFPDYKLRAIRDRQYGSQFYSVYDVCEGGKYYVFWYADDEAKPFEIGVTYYIEHLVDVNDLQKIDEGTPLEEVLQIDPSAAVFEGSVCTSSFSLANDGSVYKIDYKLIDHHDYVSSVEVVDGDGCDLCFIVSEDYP
jgi:hypothetical protein